MVTAAELGPGIAGKGTRLTLVAGVDDDHVGEDGAAVYLAVAHLDGWNAGAGSLATELVAATRQEAIDPGRLVTRSASATNGEARQAVRIALSKR